MCACGGGGILGGLSYREFVQLWLNRDRMMQRRAGEVAMGIAAAMSKIPSAEFVAANTDSDAAGAAAMSQAEARAKMADSMAGFGFGG